MARGIKIQHEGVKEIAKEILEKKSKNSVTGETGLEINEALIETAPEKTAPSPTSASENKKEFDVKKAMQMEMLQKMRS